MVAKPGMDRCVSNALLDITSTKMVCVVKLNLNAKISMSKLVYVRSVTKDIKYLMVNVFFLMLANLKIKDVKIGRMEFVSNVQLGGI